MKYELDFVIFHQLNELGDWNWTFVLWEALGTVVLFYHIYLFILFNNIYNESWSHGAGVGVIIKK